ncbi:MAG: right-handed parallel beta-helix repeat-containing protein, partial [Methanobacteriota archaeon]
MEIRDLVEWQASSGHDANSVSTYGHYSSETDLHTVAPWLDKKGIPFSRITTDIDGEPRDGTTPDIGADEFIPDPATTIPMAGIYTVGTGGDYSTLNDVAYDLALRGVSDSVTIRLSSGNHNSQATFRPVPGVSESNTITIESESGNADNTTISYAATSAEDNFVIRLMGSRYLSLKNLTISATNSSGSDFGRALDLVGGIDFLTIEGCVLTGISGVSGSTDRSLVRMNISYFNSVFIRGNQFLNGSYGIEMRGYAGNNHKTYGLIAENNQFTNNGYTGMYLYDVDGVKIRNNIFKSDDANYGLYLRGCNGSTEISKNKINIGGTSPLYLMYCSGANPPSTYRILISNNFISAFGGAAQGAFTLYECSNLDVIYNSVYT